MKTKYIVWNIVWTIVWMAAAGPGGVPSARAQDAGPGPAQPVITSISLEPTNVTVRVRVPAGIRRVALQGCRRLGGEAWSPRAVAHLDGAGGDLTLRIGRSPDLELLRVRGDEKEPLPASFFQGQTTFAGQPTGSVLADGRAAPGGGLEWVVFDGANGGSTPAAPVAGRTVSESDIWNLDGDTLYFFNQYRGLQVIDVSQPDAPAIRGVLPLAATGEQMYLLDAGHVVLLTHDACSGAAAGASQVMIVDVRGAKPVVTASLSLEGTTSESRLVGTALYVASSAYRVSTLTNSNATGGMLWESGTVVTSFDLAEPTQPVTRSTAWIPGGGSVVTATDRFLFVATRQAADWSWHPAIQVFDISAPDGVMKAVSKLDTVGQVRDKFNLSLEGDVLSVVSDQTWTGTATTWVETFTLADPAAPARLGALKLVEGEMLFSSRFQGNRLYAVTFHRVDPLWVVDLSDPTQPRVTGQLEVPGWSTYLHPLGDRLLAVGRDNTGGWRTVLSLFDVRDPAHPGLLSRQILGDQYSSSGANFDEKALGVFPEAGLVLLPVTVSSTNATFQGVQLVDLTADALAFRGRISQSMEPRRATLHRDRILTWTGMEMLSVDATDRDHPQVRTTTDLAWRVDQVLLSGPYLLEVDRGWWNSADGRLRVAFADDPDHLVNGLSLTNLPLLGVSQQGDRLYVAQGRSGEITWHWDSAGQTNIPVSTNLGVFSLSVVDLSQLPALPVLGRAEAATAASLWGTWEALLPRPGLVVWKSRGYDSYFPWLRGGPIPLAGGGFEGGPVTPGPVAIDWVGAMPVSRVGFGWPWYGGYGPGRLFAFDVSDPAAPAFASETLVGADQGWNTTSRGFTADGLAYLSHREMEMRVTGTNVYVYTNTLVEMLTNVVSVTNVVQVPHYDTVTNYNTVVQVTPVAVLNRPAAGSWLWPGPYPLAGTIAGGGSHSLLLDAQGTVWDWGANGVGQLGDGGDPPARAEIRAVPGLAMVRAVAAGALHSLSLQSDGTVRAWGGDAFGQLGDGLVLAKDDGPPLPDTGSAVPVPVADLAGVTAIAAGGFHSLALRNDGAVWAWGANWYGQLGADAPNSHDSPRPVPYLDNVRALAGGRFHSLALKSDGTVWAWGRNDLLQLGITQAPEDGRPAVVPGISGATAVAAGMWHSLALMPGGTVWGWGGDASGQLADGGAEGGRAPAAIEGLSDVTAVAAGLLHSVALKSDGTVWTWGDNTLFQLGRGTAADRARPGPVGGLSNAVAVAAGGYFSLALTREGTVWAWGDNAFGQLGDGAWLNATNEFVRTNVSMVLSYTSVTNTFLKTNYNQVVRLVAVTNAVPLIQWFEHHYLDVVDYEVPDHPVVRPPVDIPGVLEGIAYDGALLYTQANRPATAGGPDWAEWLDATAYDGVEAHLVDSLALPAAWAHPLKVTRDVVFLGRPAADTNSTPQLETWTVGGTGKFTKLSGASLAQPALYLEAFDDLLAAQSGRDVVLFDARDPARLAAVGAGGPPGCIGFNLEDAAGSLTRGLWLPLGEFGVFRVNPGQPASTP